MAQEWLNKFFTNFSEAYGDSLEAESEAYQAGFGLAADTIEAVEEAGLRPVRQALGDSAEEFTSEDISYTLPSVRPVSVFGMQDRKVTIPKGAVNFAGDTVLSPLNLVGAGLFTRGKKAVDALTGPMSGRGMLLTSPPNYIPNFYGLTDVPKGTKPNSFDEFVFRNKETIANIGKNAPKVGNRFAARLREAKNPADIMADKERIKGFTSWLMGGARNAAETLFSPSGRALYRDTGINPSMQMRTEGMLSRPVTSSRRPDSKALAEGQFNYLVGEVQAGRQGAVDPALREIISRSYLTEATPFTKGSYSDLIRDNKLSGFAIEGGKEVRKTPRTADLEFIEEHLGRVWLSGKGERFADAASPQIVVKAPTNKLTGNHHYDFRMKSGVFPMMDKIFKENPNPSKAEFFELLQKHTGDKVLLHRKSRSFEDADENGFWVTGSFTGTAVTEGSVNFVAKVQPNGRILSVVSDEHNFLEGMPIVGGALEKALPNRVVAVTPPMFFNSKAKIGAKAARGQASEEKYREVLEGIASARPREEVVRAEQMKQAGAIGMLTGAAFNEDKEQQR